MLNRPHPDRNKTGVTHADDQMDRFLRAAPLRSPVSSQEELRLGLPVEALDVPRGQR